MNCCDTEPAQWIFAAQVQERLRLAEAVGRFHEFLSVFLQVAPGKSCTAHGPVTTTANNCVHNVLDIVCEWDVAGKGRYVIMHECLQIATLHF